MVLNDPPFSNGRTRIHSRIWTEIKPIHSTIGESSRMKLSRRDAILAVGGATVLAGCSNLSGQARNFTRVPAAPVSKADDEAVAVLNRFGFGPNIADLNSIKELGVEKWFDRQLSPNDDEPAHLGFMLQRLDINSLGPYDLRDWKEDAIVAQLQQASLLRAVYSPWQVRERLCDFWTNHFNIFAKKGLAAYRKPMDERNVVRANALGKFPEMIRASAKSTAMLVFLDQQNSNPKHPNENYARELLELHTLGVNGGYSQQDVQEVARCFTGWTEERGFLRKKGAFLFQKELHDSGEKFVLGHRIPAGQGIEDGETVLSIVAEHPSTARYISQKLCNYYLGEEGKKYETQVSETFRKTQGDIPSMMRDLLKAFRECRNSIVKRPYDFTASAIRATEASTDAGIPILNAMASMGQPLFLWPMPDGYPVDTASWTGSMLARWNFAVSLTKGEFRGTSVDFNILTENLNSKTSAAQIVFSEPEVSNNVQKLSKIAENLDLNSKFAVCLASPEFQWK